VEQRHDRLPPVAVHRLSATLALLVALIAGWALAGELVGRHWLLSDHASAGLHVTSAAAAVLLSLALLARHELLRMPRLVERCMLVGAVLLAATALPQTGDHMPRVGAVVTVLLALAIWTLRRTDVWVVIGDSLALLGIALAALVLYTYGVDAARATASVGGTRPGSVGALLFGLLAGAVLIAAPARGGIAGLFASRSAGGSAARWFAPATLLVPIVLEMVRFRLERAGVFEESSSVVATSEAFAVALTLLGGLLIGATYLDRIEGELRRTREVLFMSTLTHELRTPLVAIRNLTEVVDQQWERIDEELRRAAVRTAHEQSRTLLALLHDTSQLRRLDVGSLPAQPTGIALCDGIAAALEEREVEASVDCPPTLRVWVDPEHLRLLLGACLRLALRAGPGPIAIRATATGEDACVYVEIPSHPAPAEPLREDASGWSLWTVAELARQWGGDAAFERLGEDRSQFVVTLPLAALVPTEFRA
jgi:signal transduction histidine kinase